MATVGRGGPHNAMFVVWGSLKRSRTTAASDSSTEYAMNELSYEPRNLREKWLLRIAYYGTILVVAFLLWEYIKTK